MRAEFERTFSSYSIFPYFSYAVCADDLADHKPHPAPLLKCIEDLSVSPCESLYIGDSRYDLKCAASAKVDFALALWGCREPEQFSCKRKLSSPEELLLLYIIIYPSHASILPSLPPRGYSRGSKGYISVSFLHIYSVVQIDTDCYPIHLYETVSP